MEWLPQTRELFSARLIKVDSSCYLSLYTLIPGYTKILVVTSVAEEGLDISACNLIIKYNTVGSERTMIQRRGRARAVDSKSVLICLDEAIEQREFANIARELNMKLCLQDLQVCNFFSFFNQQQPCFSRKAQNN